jgi:hypothetical protein
MLDFDNSKFIVDSSIVVGIHNMGDYREIELCTGGIICVRETTEQIVSQLFRKGR